MTMGQTTLLGELSDRRRICIMLRADGWSFEEIGAFLGITVRQVRCEFERLADRFPFPDLLDHRRSENQGRVLRLLYLLGASDAGVPIADMPAMLDSLVERAEQLRARREGTAA